MGKSTRCDGVYIKSETSSYSSAKDKNPITGGVEYYGRILDIVELNYSNQTNVVLFKCEWAKPAGIRTLERFGVTQINFNEMNAGQDIQSEPFIFASQAKQVYYVQDVIDADWNSVVFPATRDYFE